MRGGIDNIIKLRQWYKSAGSRHHIGHFQIGGGIAGSLPLTAGSFSSRNRDWGYFCTISDATTSYGSFSGRYNHTARSRSALNTETSHHVIQSDASIVAPLIFAVVLNW